MDVGICIMAGGKSSRMGMDKNCIKNIEGKTFLQLKIEEMFPFKYRYLSINDSQNFNANGYENVTDVIKDAGPLGGIYSVLCAMKTDACLFVASDMPFYDYEEAVSIINSYEGQSVFMAKTKDGLQPLASIYSKTCIPYIKQLIDSKSFRIRKLYELADDASDYYSTRDKCYVNVNTVDELNRIK